MRFFVYITLIAALLFSFVPTQAMLAATVVEPANPNGWMVVDDNGKGLGLGEFVSGPGTAPLGTGSAHLVLNDSTAGWIFTSAMQNGTKLADLEKLEYSTYVTTNTGVQTIALGINVDYDVTDDNDAWQGRLVYEPYHTQNDAVIKGEWQTWNPITSEKKWFASGGAGKVSCPQSAPCTWSDILAEFPKIGFHNTMGAVSFKAGSGWATFDGNFDNFVIGVSGEEQTFDFEPTTTGKSPTVYVDHNFFYVHPDTNVTLPLPLYSDPDGDGPATSMGFDASWTVQGGVDLVATGGTVNVAAGEYTEQVIVRDLDGIAIEGAGEQAVTIIAPTNILVTTVNSKNLAVRPIVFVDESVNVTITGLTVDGAGTGNTNNILHGIHYRNSSGLVDYVTITAVRHAELSGTQGGNGFYGHNTDGLERTITVRESTVVDYQKNGISFSGAGLTANVDKNVVTGAGETGVIAQNGIQIGDSAKGAVTGNTVTKHQYTGSGWSSTGIMVAAGSDVEVSSNVVTDNMVGVYSDLSTAAIARNYISSNQWGIAVNGGEADITANNITSNDYGVDLYTYNATYTASATVNHNRFYDNTTYGVANEIAVAAGEVAPALNAVDNWWGCNEGPSNTVDCDGIYEGDGSQPVTTTTWLKLTLDVDENHVINGRPANLVASITTNSANVDVSNVADFPDDMNVIFATTEGVVTPAETDLIDGSAASVLTVAKGATLKDTTVSVTLDNETVEFDLLTGLLSFWLPIITR